MVDILKSSNKYDCDGLDLPSDGLVMYPLNDYDAVVGIWIMPNNRFEGMLEDFALNMIPAEDLLIRKVEVVLQSWKQKGYNATSKCIAPRQKYIRSWHGRMNRESLSDKLLLLVYRMRMQKKQKLL